MFFYFHNLKGEVTDVSEKQKREVRHLLNREKIRVLLYPLTIATLLYGVWLSTFPNILERYAVYNHINDFVTPWQVGISFIVLPIIIFIAFKLNYRLLLLIASLILLMLWSMFTVSFFLSPPPNTVWIFTALLAYMTFSLIRRV